MGSKSRRRDEALQSKKDICARKINNAYNDVDVNMLSTETAWLSRSSGVVFKSQKKVEAKEAEDRKKVEDQKKEVKRRKRG